MSEQNKIERRTVKVQGLTVRKSEEQKFSGIRGTAVVFNSLSENLGGFREQIDPNAFEGCELGDVRCLFNHDDSRVLGRTVSGTLKLSLDKDGLHFDCDAPDTSYARDLRISMDRGDIDQCSFAFTVAPGGADWDEDSATGGAIRTVKKISRLFDVSIVTYPAYPETSSEIRSNADILNERQTAPPALPGGGVDAGLLRRKLDLEFYSTC